MIAFISSDVVNKLKLAILLLTANYTVSPTKTSQLTLHSCRLFINLSRK